MNIMAKLKPGDKPTREQLERIERAAMKPISQDDDSPVYTPEQLAYLYEESTTPPQSGGMADSSDQRSAV